MPYSRRHLLGAAASFGALASLRRVAVAAGYPDRAIKAVVPYPAGGVVDVVTRIVTEAIGARWGQPVVVENRAGANGNLGAQAVKAAAPDGYTWLAGSLSLAVNPLIDRNARFALDDFQPVAALGWAPNLLVVPASSPVASVKEFVALAKQNPGRLNVPVAGIGSSIHLSLELLQQHAGIELFPVNYKGQPPFLVDLVNGQLQFAFLTAALAVPHLQSGRLRALAVSAPARLASLPGVPTLAEAGYGDAVVLPWSGIFTPAGTPSEVVERVAAEVKQALHAPESLRRHAAVNAVVPAADLAFAPFIAAEARRWRTVVAERRITAEAA